MKHCSAFHFNNFCLHKAEYYLNRPPSYWRCKYHSYEIENKITDMTKNINIKDFNMSSINKCGFCLISVKLSLIYILYKDPFSRSHMKEVVHNINTRHKKTKHCSHLLLYWNQKCIIDILSKIFTKDIGLLIYDYL